MSYKEKPQLKLYKYENNSFILQAIIDDYQECSFEDNLYEAGQFSITINFNIPNSQLFQRGLFIQFGNSWKFGEITKIQDQIGEEGKGSQFRIITGFDARYILKRRVIKNMNSNGLWVMTGKGEIVLRNLINDQAGTNAEEKRKLPITNTIPDSETAIGKEYSASEQFSNLYEVCKTIATQSEIGWRLEFNGTSLNLVCFEGTDRTQTVQFSTSFDSLANGEFIDSSESFANAIYVGGKGDNEERDIYEGENGTPSGLDRFESFDNQSQMTTESEYEAEALSMLTQYGQTIQMNGNGLAKCPYIYKEQYDVGDLITVAFSGKSAVVQILSVTEHWTWGNYNIQFSFGKPQNNLSEQLQLMLRKIQSASNKEKATESVKWYNVANVNSMSASDVTFNTIGFTGTLTANKTFTLYLDNEKTGAKSYNIYVKNLSCNFNLTLTTGRSGKTNYVLKGGVNLTGRILVDDEGNITSQSVTATSVIESGNNQPATSGAVAEQTEVTKSSDSTPYSQRVNADKDKSVINKLIGASFAVNQLVKNGNFANTSNWNFTSGTVSVSNGVVTLTPSQQYGWIEQPIPIRKGHQMLVIGTCKSYTNTGTQIKLRQTRPSNPYFDTSRTLSTTKTTYAFVVPIVDDTTYCQVIVQDNNTSGWGAITIENVQAIDLTQMLGSAIADRIRAMENASARSGIAWIKSFGFFNNAYYATDEGSVQNVKPSAHKVSASVVKWFTSRNVSSQDLVSLYSEAILKPNTNYTLYFRGAYGAKIYANENIFTTIGTATLNGSLQSIALKTKTELPYNNSTRLEDGWAIFKNAQGNTVAPNFTEFYIVEEGVKADPTFSQTTSFADTELRGIPKLDSNNNLYYDGDVYYSNGDVIRKYASLTNQSGAVGETITLTGYKTNGNIICSKGAISNIGTISGTTLNLTSAISGETIIYELATPTKETVAGYSNPHTLIRKGAEEFVDNRTIALPVGHETEYAKLPGWLSNNVIFL